VIYLDLEALLHVATRTLGAEPEVRDHGLMESALARPQASAFGADAYAGIHEKAAALLHSLARSRSLVDGNKRLAFAATLAFYGMNGIRLTFTNDEAYDFVINVATGQLDDVAVIAAQPEAHSIALTSPARRLPR
jgi:death on curing protein